MKIFVSYELRGPAGDVRGDGRRFATVKGFTEYAVAKCLTDLERAIVDKHRAATGFTDQLMFRVVCLVKLDDPPRPGVNGTTAPH